MKKNQNGSAVVVLLIIIVIGLIGAVGWLMYDKQKSKTDDSQNSQAATQNNQQTETNESTKNAEQDTPEDLISDDIVVCDVNTSAQSGAGLKVAFYGYVKGSAHSDIKVKYGKTSDSLTSETAAFPDGDDECNQLLAHMPREGLEAGMYFYQVTAKTKAEETVHSKTASFTIN